MSMMQHRYVGLDVHRATISVAIADPDQAPVSYGKIANEPTAIHKLMQKLGGPERIVHVAYEAGPTGYVVQRQLSELGIDCLVVAPSLIPVRAGDRVKTDRRDALKLARLLRSGDLTAVWVPDREHEALRNLVRARADAKVDELRAKHRLSKFLLRLGVHPPVGMRNWSQRLFQWLRQVEFEHLADRIGFADYLAEVTAAGVRIKRLEAALGQCAESSNQMGNSLLRHVLGEATVGSPELAPQSRPAFDVGEKHLHEPALYRNSDFSGQSCHDSLTSKLVLVNLRGGQETSRMLDMVGTVIPESPGRLIGRAAEVALVHRQLTDNGVRLLTLSGVGGIGKTRVALEVARIAHADFEDGTVFVDLARFREPELVVSAIQAAVAPDQAAGSRPPLDVLKRTLRSRHTLLVL